MKFIKRKINNFSKLGIKYKRNLIASREYTFVF